MHINVTDQNGKRHRLEALEGFRVMEIIRDWGLDIKAECGGACACATCHVHVDEDWTGKLHRPLDEEIDMLDMAFDVRDNSRLSCQLIMTAELDGLEVTLAPGTQMDRRDAA
jgi:ferredoxin, 2Fe-2S